jgi:hypothetical protein
MSQQVFLNFKPAARLLGDPEAMLTELEAAYAAGGGLTPEAVLEKARSRKSALHAHVFNKNVSEAAETYYLERAGGLIRFVTVMIVEEDGTEHAPQRAYLPVMMQEEPLAPDDVGGLKRRVYIKTERALAEPELRVQVLANALRELQALRAKYAGLTELAEVFSALDKVAKRAQRKMKVAA